MKLSRRYLITGIAWALLLGPAAALALFGLAAGASWLWLFGDDPWPEAARWVLPLMGLAGGLVTAAACIFIAISYGRQRETMPQADLPQERRRAAHLTIAPLVLMAVISAALWKQAADYAEAMNLATQREAAFAELLGARHEITGIAVREDDSGAFHGTAEITGDREGRYRLRWKVSGTTFGAVLAEGERTLLLRAGRQVIEITFNLEDLARRYREKVLSGGGVLVEEPFELTATLEPALSEAEQAALPPGERRLLKLGESPLLMRETAQFPVRFIIGSDGGIRR